MKLQEIKDFVKELRGLSQEELAKKENELKKNCLIFVSKLQQVNLKRLLALTKLRNKLHVLKLCNQK